MKKALIIIIALILIGGLIFFFIKRPASQTPRSLGEVGPIPISFQQVKSDPQIKAVIDSSKKVNGNLEVTFHHNSQKAEPVSLTGAVNYKLSKALAQPGEKITLTVYNWTSEYFEIKVGANSDHFAFGKKTESLDNDEPVLKELQKQGINKADVVLEQDYAPKVAGKKQSPYSKVYKDTKSGKYILVSQGLPQVTDDGAPIDVGWTQQGNKFVEKNNLFKATVDGNNVELKVRNDQPDGRKANDKLNFHAQLFLNNVEQTPAGPTLLAVDPTNSNYINNVLEWDYGIAKRRLRLIEGNVLGSWVFNANPGGEVRLKYNQTGDYKLKLGQYKFNDDEERVSSAQFNSAQYPFTVNDTGGPYYPNASGDPSPTSVDGYVGRTGFDENWAAIIANAGNDSSGSGASSYPVYIGASTTLDQWNTLLRGIYLFDASGLPDAAVVSSATLSLYGVSKSDEFPITPNINIYASTPASPTALVDADYGRTGGANPTPFSDTPKTYADWSTGAYNDFDLNASGIAAISTTTVSKFSARNANYDAAGSAPLTWGSGKISFLEAYNSEQGTGFKPKLTLIYDTPPTLTSISASTNPIPAQGNQTITASGQGDVDISEWNILRIYCCQDTANTCTPTTANTCNNNQAWASPYTNMTCTLFAPNVTTNTTYYARCLTYDGLLYSGTTQSASYTVTGTSGSTMDIQGINMEGININ